MEKQAAPVSPVTSPVYSDDDLDQPDLEMTHCSEAKLRDPLCSLAFIHTPMGSVINFRFAAELNSSAAKRP